MPELRELQQSFAAGLRGATLGVDAWADGTAIPADGRLRVYRNNARMLFERALELTYPVVAQRVGDEFFRQQARDYRRTHPSRCGDLHEVGRHFPSFIAPELANGPYAWLSELAALEWAVAEAGVAADSTTAAVAALAGVPADRLESVQLRFVPSLQLVCGSAPVFSVWRANQPGAGAEPVDLAAGPQYLVIHRRGDTVQLRGLARAEFDFVAALDEGMTLGDALERSMLPVDDLAGLLHWLFGEDCVAAVSLPSST